MRREVVDIAGVPVGVLIPTAGQLRFVAVKFQVFEFDGRMFGSVSDARSAISGFMNTANGH